MKHKSFHLSRIPGDTESLTKLIESFRFSLVGLLLSMAPFGVAAVLFGYASQFYTEGHELRQEIIDSGRSLNSVPPTQLGHHPAMAVVCVFVGLIFVIWAFRVMRWGATGQYPMKRDSLLHG